MNKDRFETEKVESIPNLITYGRIWQIDSERDENVFFLDRLNFKDEIDWASTKEENHKQFEREGEIYYLVHSQPVWYYFGSDRFKITDLLVIGRDREEVLKEFHSEVSSRRSDRERAREIADQIASDLIQLESAVVVMGRGSMFDDRRIPVRQDDIDLMIFINKLYRSSEDIPELIKAIKSALTKYAKYSVFLNVHDNTMSGGSVKIIQGDKKQQFNISIDVISLLLLEQNRDKITRLLTPYSVETLQHGKVLRDKTEGQFDELKEFAIGKYLEEKGL